MICKLLERLSKDHLVDFLVKNNLINPSQHGFLKARSFSFIWFTTGMWSVVEYPVLNTACSRGWFSSSVFYSIFISTFVSTLSMFDSRHIGL